MGYNDAVRPRWRWCSGHPKNRLRGRARQCLSLRTLAQKQSRGLQSCLVRVQVSHVLPSFYRCGGRMRSGDYVTYDGQDYYRLMVNGYYTLYKIVDGRVAYEEGYQLEHRLVYEIAHNVKLPRNVSVHHINHNRSDNRIENLEILSQSEHARKHAIEEGKRAWSRRCIDCGAEICTGSTRCIECSNKHQQTPMHPTKEQLAEYIKTMKNSEIAKMCKVGNTTVRKWRRQYGLPSATEQRLMQRRLSQIAEQDIN